jgi:putative PIN family toxin of toxin-antitoxin system
MRAVLDTNVLVSTVISTGTPYRIYNAWLDDSFDLVTSLPLLAELEDVLARPRISERIPSTSSRGDELLTNLHNRAVWVDPGQQITCITADPDDNRVLEAAVEGDVEFIVSGDRHLLDLGQHESIEIVTPAQFLAILATETHTS